MLGPAERHCEVAGLVGLGGVGATWDDGGHVHIDTGREPAGPVVAALRARGAPPVEVVRSAARRRTSSASVRGGRIVVRVPADLTPTAEAVAVDDLLRRLQDRAVAPSPATPLPRRVASRWTRGPSGPRGDQLLVVQADAVADRWLATERVRAVRVDWSHRMFTRWASCTTPPGRIRISHRVADAPDEVLDVLLLHELAHIVHSGHGPAFKALVARHPATADVDAWLSRRTHEELRAALGLA